MTPNERIYNITTTSTTTQIVAAGDATYVTYLSLVKIGADEYDEVDNDCDDCEKCGYDPCECAAPCEDHEECTCSWCGSNECPVCCGCCGCGYYGNVAPEEWGLPQGLNLVPLAADFYLLYELSLDGLDEGRFRAWMDENLPIFKNYTDMVIGGEIRHAPSHFLNKHKALPESPLRTLLEDELGGIERTSAWEAWYEFRQEHGTKALEWITEVYNKWPSAVGQGYGGRAWASISDALWMLETGITSPVAFVDMCWGLQHNGGTYFNKLDWLYNVESVLTANLREDTTTVLRYATSEVQRLYEEAYEGR